MTGRTKARESAVYVRLSAGEELVLETAATEAGKPLATWIREAALAAAHNKQQE
jgi:hypothetical protein